MESFLVPALILLVVVAGVLTAVGLSRKRAGRSPRPSATAAGRGPAPTREAAVAANARLDQQQHTAVYSLIARGRGLEAIQAYRQATGAGLREAATAVASLSAYPQPYVFPDVPRESGAPEPAAPAAESTVEPAGGPEPETGPRTAAPKPEPKDEAGPAGEHLQEHRAEPPAPARPAEPAADPGSTDVPGKHSPSSPPAATGAAAAHRPTAYRYRAIVSKGDEIREIASTRLNDAVYSRIRETALAGDLAAAARLLREHSDAGEQEALEFVALIGPEED
ncbi:hypothetical protein LVY72_07855 [Arthrobacter sp. I2-34]|uniref:Ribosomal protein L7/L12 C-terminal domain-containing protein n=1 Tax=Arthrobacter hankyongi TaxID=2904801 RepID=A0ABS9L5D5_9MICC|nr:hypothetical protein [Arthrobacter hankyongi]MCG2621831.1 hypothetical protein [Arthrobacter hankyongi]